MSTHLSRGSSTSEVFSPLSAHHRCGSFSPGFLQVQEATDSSQWLHRQRNIGSSCEHRCQRVCNRKAKSSTRPRLHQLFRIIHCFCTEGRKFENDCTQLQEKLLGTNAFSCHHFPSFLTRLPSLCGRARRERKQATRSSKQHQATSSEFQGLSPWHVIDKLAIRCAESCGTFWESSSHPTKAQYVPNSVAHAHHSSMMEGTAL